MDIFTYKSDAPNEGIYEKTGTSKPSYRIDFTDGLASNAVTISSVNIGAVNSDNMDATASVVSGSTTSGAVVTVALLTAGTSGTAPAVDDAQFRVRTTATLSDGRIIAYDNFIIIDAPTYAP